MIFCEIAFEGELMELYRRWISNKLCDEERKKVLALSRKDESIICWSLTMQWSWLATAAFGARSMESGGSLRERRYFRTRS